MTLDSLRRDVRQFMRLALAKYDTLESDPTSLRNRLALTVDNRQRRDNPVRLTEDFITVQAGPWEDEMVASGRIDKLEYTVPMRGYHAALPFNNVNIGRPNVVATLERMAAALPAALMRLQVKLLMNVFRLNPLTVDGQSFWSDAHVHPNDATYDNTLDFTAADPDPANITFDEGKAILHRAMARIATNQGMEAEVVDAGEIGRDLIVIAHNATHWGVLNLVRTRQINENTPNELAGAFTLLLDRNPTSGDENKLEVVHTPPSGPRPAFFVPDTSPILDAWDDKSRNGYSVIAMKEQFGIKAGHAHVAVQVTVGT